MTAQNSHSEQSIVNQSHRGEQTMTDGMQKPPASAASTQLALNALFGEGEAPDSGPYGERENYSISVPALARAFDRALASVLALPAQREEKLEVALRHVRAIITEGGMTGFNCRDGDWAERLFASQAVTHDALSPQSEPRTTQSPAVAWRVKAGEDYINFTIEAQARHFAAATGQTVQGLCVCDGTAEPFLPRQEVER